jgi:hypothetical protein
MVMTPLSELLTLSACETALGNSVADGKEMEGFGVLPAAYLAEAIDVADFKAKKAEVDARRGSVERELMRLEEEHRQLETAALETTTLIDYCRQVVQSLRQLGLSSIAKARRRSKPPESSRA